LPLTQHSKFRLKEEQGELGSAHPLGEKTVGKEMNYKDFF
jgi:hypothetical protein